MHDDDDRAAVRIFPPAIPLLLIGTGLGLSHFWPIGLPFAVPAPACYWLGGAIAVGALLGLGAWSVLVMRSSGQTVNPFKPTFDIVDRGPFRVSRNPMYLQMVIVCFGVGIASMSWWLILLTPACGWLLQRLAIVPEERYLERKFGESYLAYKRQVRRWL